MPYELVDDISLPVPGQHNRWNASAAFAVSKHWKISAQIYKALAEWQPVARRFETVFNRHGIRIISDYAHHPTEIGALIRTAQELKPGRLMAVFQPHRYTRTLALGEDFPPSFNGLDRLWLVPVYAASEQPLAGGTSKDLAERFSSDWHQRLVLSSSLATAWGDIQRELQEGDLLLVIGAGDIEQVADWAKKWYPGEGSNLLPTD